MYRPFPALLSACLLAGCMAIERKSGSSPPPGQDTAGFLSDHDPFASGGGNPDREPAAAPAPDRGFHRVVSLKAVDRALSACPSSPLCRDSLFLTLGGITTVQGVAFDERTGDVLLFGEVEAGAPALHLDVLVVALRNAWLSYVHQRGNRITYLHPGLSLEPTEATLKDLRRIARDIARIDAAGGEKALERWKEACRRPYRVAVTGLPADSRFTGVLLRADYAMKGLANGSENLELHGFPGMAELRKIRFQGAQPEGGSPPPPTPSLARYWFHPGSQEWEAAEGIIVLKRSPVVLMTEEMFAKLRAGDGGAEAPPADELADAFAYGFTRMYGKVAEARPVFRELGEVFRLVAAAKLIRDRFPEAEAKSAFPALFRGYRLPEVPVDGQVPGIPDLQHFDHARTTPMGMEIDRYWLPSCGGVTVAVEPSKAWTRRLRDPALSRFRKAAASRRPADTAWRWDVAGTPGDYWEVLRERMRLQELCQRFPDLAFFRVRRAEAGGKGVLELVDEDDHVLRSGQARNLMEEVAVRADARKVHSVFLELGGWPAGQAQAFRDAAADFVKQREPAWTVVPVADRPGWLRVDNPIFSHSADWEPGEPPLETVASGAYRGWHRLTFRFLTSVSGKTVPVSLHVMVKSGKTAARLQEEAAKAFRTRLFIAYSPLAALLSVVTEFREGLPGSEKKDVRIVEDEAGLLELG